MRYREAVRYLNSLADYEKTGHKASLSFDLERMRRLAELFDKPQESFRSIHIAGTKGKGSVAAFISAVLMEEGFRAGLYTSPHLVTPRERIKVNNEMISEAALAFHAGGIKKKLAKKNVGFTPTYFEIYTLLAFNYFRARKIDFGVIETGLGGRLDATNIVRPLVSVITPVSRDHTRVLGEDVKSIAVEKSAIIKKKSTAVSAPQDEKVIDIIRKRCRRLGARLILAGEDIKFSEISHDTRREVFDIAGENGNYGPLLIRLLGRHQIANAACAIGAIEALGKKISVPAIKKGLAKARNPARCEVMARKPYIVLDGAQNRASAAALKETIKRNFSYRRLILVLGISKEKDIKGVCDELFSAADHVILTRAITKRAESPRVIARFAGKKNVTLTNSVNEAMKKARSLAGEPDMILAAGSFYVAGEIKKMKVNRTWKTRSLRYQRL